MTLGDFAFRITSRYLISCTGYALPEAFSVKLPIVSIITISLSTAGFIDLIVKFASVAIIWTFDTDLSQLIFDESESAISLGPVIVSGIAFIADDFLLGIEMTEFAIGVFDCTTSAGLSIYIEIVGVVYTSLITSLGCVIGNLSAAFASIATFFTFSGI